MMGLFLKLFPFFGPTVPWINVFLVYEKLIVFIGSFWHVLEVST